MDTFISDLAHDIEVAKPNVKVEKNNDNGIEIVSTTIGDNEKYNGVLRRKGSYFAIDNCLNLDKNSLILALSNIIAKFIFGKKRILIVGFGNSQYVIDKLGIEVISNINKNINEKVKVATISPLVNSVTGIDSIDIVDSIKERFDADMIIAIDTLSTSNVSRLANSIQVTDAGLSIGAGVQNVQSVVDSSSMNVPLIAIGVPLLMPLRLLTSKDTDIKYVSPSMLDTILQKYAKIIASSITKAISSI